MVEERTIEEAPIPPYFDRFIEERDRRFIAELGRLETLIMHNTQRIDGLRQEMERRIDELRQEIERRFAEAKADREAIREEMRQGFARLDAKIDGHFRWTISLMIPIVVGILAIIRVFFLGPIP